MAPQNNPPIIRACLFDMDGLLINSEDLYTTCTNEVLREFGKPDLPWNIKAQLQGRPASEATRIFHTWAQLPITNEEYATKLSALQRKYFPDTKPLDGVVELLRKLKYHTEPEVHIALATSSHKGNYELKTTKLKPLFSVFGENRILGDDPRILPGRGKPAPDIYLEALKIVNAQLPDGETKIKPEECLVFEDSVPGVEAGRRAGMQVLWCPHIGLLEEYRGREKEVLAGLTGEHKEDTEGENLAEEAEIEEEEKTGKVRRYGAPGKIDDGWGRLFKSLKNFPYEDYGIVAKPQAVRPELVKLDG